jgi:hypothetical protein
VPVAAVLDAAAVAVEARLLTWATRHPYDGPLSMNAWSLVVGLFLWLLLRNLGLQAIGPHWVPFERWQIGRLSR